MSTSSISKWPCSHEAREGVLHYDEQEASVCDLSLLIQRPGRYHLGDLRFELVIDILAATVSLNHKIERLKTYEEVVRHFRREPLQLYHALSLQFPNCIVEEFVLRL